MIQDSNNHGCIANPEDDAAKYPMTAEDPHKDMALRFNGGTVPTMPAVWRVQQPAPVSNDNPHIVDLVKADLDKRRALGVQKYGTALQAHNGRDALQDAYEEALDLCQYLRQAIEQREVPRG